MSETDVFSKLNYIYRGFWDEYGSESVAHLPLVSGGPWKVLGIVVVYLWFVKVKGPKMMKDRGPYEIKSFILGYNIFIIGLHAVLFPLAIWATDFGQSCWRCQKIDLVNSENLVKENIAVLLGYTYFITKFFELLDTVFFILRKKTNQVTGLHVFHHSMMPVFCYIGAKFSPWHTVGWIAILNAFVHIIMYSYYTLALLGIKHFFWLKKYITRLQIFQFCLIVIHAIYFLQDKTCEWPKLFPIMQLLHGIQFLYMFSSFYYRAYLQKKEQEKKNI